MRKLFLAVITLSFGLSAEVENVQSKNEILQEARQKASEQRNAIFPGNADRLSGLGTRGLRDPHLLSDELRT